MGTYGGLDCSTASADAVNLPTRKSQIDAGTSRRTHRVRRVKGRGSTPNKDNNKENPTHCNMMVYSTFQCCLLKYIFLQQSNRVDAYTVTRRKSDFHILLTFSFLYSHY